MSQITKTLVIDKVRQLVDLNGELTNFNARFIITPKSDAPYEYTIASQTMLDNAETLSFLPAKGPVQKEFTIEEDLYQNHFLVLRSSVPHEVDVIIERQPLPSKVIPNEAATAQAVTITPPTEPEVPIYKQLWFQVVVLCIVVAGAYYIYTKYFKKSSQPASSDVYKKYNFASANPRYHNVNLFTESPKADTLTVPPPVSSTPAAPVAITPIPPVVSTPTPAPAVVEVVIEKVVEATPVVVAPTPAPVVSGAPKPASPKDFTSMLLKKLRNASNNSSN